MFPAVANMQRYKILHRTYYNFTFPVRLGPHTLRLRSRESHELRIESSRIVTTPASSLRWHRDVEDNSVALATFDTATSQLLIESEAVVQHYNQAPLDLVADDALEYPFAYRPEDKALLLPYMSVSTHTPQAGSPLAQWVGSAWQAGEKIQTYALLQPLAARIAQTLTYQLREEPGVQTPTETLSRGTGSCRDSAFLYMEAVRQLGLAARFVNGYLNSPPHHSQPGSHACLGGGLSAGRRLEGVRPHHWSGRGHGSHRRRRRAPAGVRATRGRHFHRAVPVDAGRRRLGHQPERIHGASGATVARASADLRQKGAQVR
jgi:transglutaminase-like putative cysteine protease